MSQATQIAVESGRATSGSSRRKLILALSFLAAAGCVFAWYWVGESRRSRAVREADARISVTCSECHQLFDMAFSEYQSLTPMGTDVTGPIRCLRCGAEKAVSRVEVSVASPSVSVAGSGIGEGASDAEPDGDAAEEDMSIPLDLRRPAKVSAE